LGLNIPLSMSETVANTHIDNWLAIGYVLAIWMMILLIRFSWSYFSTLYRFFIGKNKKIERPNIKTSLLISLTGVRGAVTMAAALSIPFVLLSGEPFPERSLILFIATGVILVTLIIATIFLPVLCKKEADESKEINKLGINKAIVRIFMVTINTIKQEMSENYELVAYDLINEYKHMLKKIQSKQNSPETDKYLQKYTEVKILGLKAERSYIQDLFESGHVDQNVYEKFEASIDHREEMLSSNVWFSAKYILGRTIRIWHRYRSNQHRHSEHLMEKAETIKDIQLKAFSAAIKSLEKYSNKCENEYPKTYIIQAVTLDYKGMIKRLSTATPDYNEKDEDQKEELRIKAMDGERHEIQRMYESGEITKEQAKELRRHINYIESATLDE